MIKEQVEEVSMEESMSDNEPTLSGTFTLTIDLGNSAMLDKHDLAKALAGVERHIRSGNFTAGSATIRDDNGNRVGYWKIED